MANSDTFIVSLVATLPVVGQKTFTLDETLTGFEDAAANELLALDGGELQASATVTKSDDGIAISVVTELPIVGEKTFSLDEKLAGLEETTIDELIALSGGKISVTAMVTKKAA